MRTIAVAIVLLAFMSFLAVLPETALLIVIGLLLVGSFLFGVFG